MNIKNYSDKSIVVLGNTYDHREQLRNLGGVWNDHLKGGKSGWIFSAKKLDSVKQFIASISPPQAAEEVLPLLELDNDDSNNFAFIGEEPVIAPVINKRKAGDNAQVPQRAAKQAKLDEFRYSIVGSGRASINMITKAYDDFVKCFEQVTGKPIHKVFHFDSKRDDVFNHNHSWNMWLKLFKESNEINVVVGKLMSFFNQGSLRTYCYEQLQLINLSMDSLEHQILRPSIKDCFDMNVCRQEAKKYVKGVYDGLLQLRVRNGGYIYQNLRQRMAELKEEIKSVYYQLHDDFQYLAEREAQNTEYRLKMNLLEGEKNAIIKFWAK